MMNRRNFLKVGAQFGLSFHFAQYAWALPQLMEDDIRLTILHTNDVHSRIEPYPMDGSKYAGLGGVAKRAKLIERIRAEEDHVLLLDCGDIFQGTPYFNLFEGDVEIKAMNAMKYDFATIGNHDFDAGIEKLAAHLDDASFQMLNANYILKDTPLHDKVKPYQIIEKGGVKIGLFGVGIEVEGLVPKLLYGSTTYTDPIEQCQKLGKFLKYDQACDFVICISHLGYKYRSNLVSDRIIAAESDGIDLICGGHTHTFLDEPDIVKNLKDESVMITQVGWMGIKLGRLDLVFDGKKKKRCVKCSNTWVEDL